MSNDSDDYRQGLIEGRVFALEDRADTHDRRLNGHDDLHRKHERIQSMMIGAMLFIQVYPTLRAFLE